MAISPYPDITDEEFKVILEDSTIYRSITGSTAYGLSTPSSDVDEKSIIILPQDLHFRLGKEFETVTTHEPDMEYHTLKKFITLANGQNPTILEMLHTRSEFVTISSPVAEKLRQYADIFLSVNCFATYGGYAREQLMRIKNGLHRATLNDNIKFLRETLDNIINTFSLHYPNVSEGSFAVKDLDIDVDGKVDVQLILNYDGLPLKQMYGMVSELTNATKNYNKMGAKNKRAEGKLEKHAMHLIRLLMDGASVLKTGILNVYHEKDREFLLDIRNGKYTWDQIFEIVADLEDKLMQAKMKTVLPPTTDFTKVNALYTDLMIEHYAAT